MKELKVFITFFFFPGKLLILNLRRLLGPQALWEKKGAGFTMADGLTACTLFACEVGKQEGLT